MLNRTIVFSVLAVVSLGSGAQAAIREVGSGQTYTTIQACENAAASGDTCNVHAGTYTETVNVSAPGLTIRANSGDTPVLQGSFSVGSTSNVTITGFEIRGFNAMGGVYQAGGSGLTVQDCVIHDGTGAGVYSRNSTRLSVRRSKIYNNRRGTSDGDGITVHSGHSSDGTYQNGVLLEGNEIYKNNPDGMKLNGQYYTVRGNYIHDNLYSDWANTHPDGIQINAGNDDGYVGVTHGRFYNNTIKNHTQNLFISYAADIWAWNNVLYNDSGTINGVNMDSLTTQNINIRDSNGVRIYNNTIGRGTFGIRHRTTPDTHIKNNILISTIGTGLLTQDPGNFPSGELDYNAYYGWGGDTINWDGVNYGSASAFHAAHLQYEAHGIDRDPKVNAFPNATLQDGSAAIDKALDVSSACGSCATDKAGRTRSGSWDIGAFESGYTSGSPTAPSNVRIIR